MNRIKQLPPQEAQKIAAGEVVERPANIVKELIENAIDAQATKISIYIEDGGKQLIRILDDGCGMSIEDARLCFNHHATSKINSVDDLVSIDTFGFRGEALSSISSVSRVTLITKEAQSEHGVSLKLEQGIITQESAFSCERGTDITISDLFYNVPARKKFLKTKETEWRKISTLFEAFCLDYIAIHFKLFSEGKLLFNCPAVADVQQRITQLWEHTFAQHMLTVDSVTESGITIHGVISNHQYNRYDRNGLFFFVNSRWVKNYKLSQALLKGYLNVMQPGRFPAAFIFITLDGSQVDINIHPRKEEVQFLHPRLVEQLITKIVKKRLESNLAHHIKADSFISPVHYEMPPLKTQNHIMKSYDDISYMSKSAPAPIFIPPFKQTLIEKRDTQPMASFQQTIVKDELLEEHYDLLGQFNKTYILIGKADGLFMIDQHAAHERILYELFAHRFHEVATISLIFPQIIHIAAQDIKMLESHISLLHNNGIGAEIFGDNQLIIQSTPAHLKNINMQELIQQLISWIYEYQHIDKDQFFKTINEKLHAQMACKAAVKAGDSLAASEMQQLIKDLQAIDNRFTCPHGRPTAWLISIYEIEKKFKRKL